MVNEYSWKRGTPPTAGKSVGVAISLSLANPSCTENLDGLGNWRRTTFEPVGGSEETQVRQHNSVNQITSIQDEGEPKNNLSYDKSGNLLDDGVRTYEWDALNRLKKVYKTPSSPVLIGEYTYDAIGRRIRKVISNDGLSGNIPNGTTDFLYHSGISQCCEERDGSDDPFKQYVWGIYIDELLQQKTFTTINGNPAGAYYPLSDTLYRTVALTDDAGDIVEAYDTDAYGNTLIFTAPGTGSNWWADDAVTGDNPTCEFIFTGRRYDAESENYFYRERYYEPPLGRFLSRDPIIFADRDLSPYQLALGRPTSYVDPTGKYAQVLGGCVVGALISGGTSLVINLLQGDDWDVACKKASCAGLGGCVQGAAIAAFPGLLGGCIGGSLGQLVSIGCEAGFGVRPPLNKCDALNIITSTVIGCIGGAAAGVGGPNPSTTRAAAGGRRAGHRAAEADDPNLNLIITLVGLDAQLLNAMCNPSANNNIPGMKACCTFQHWGKEWKQEIDCPSGKPWTCCKEKGEGTVIWWVTMEAQMGACP